MKEFVLLRIYILPKPLATCCGHLTFFQIFINLQTHQFWMVSLETKQRKQSVCSWIYTSTWHSFAAFQTPINIFFISKRKIYFPLNVEISLTVFNLKLRPWHFGYSVRKDGLTVDFSCVSFWDPWHSKHSYLLIIWPCGLPTPHKQHKSTPKCFDKRLFCIYLS